MLHGLVVFYDIRRRVFSLTTLVPVLVWTRLDVEWLPCILTYVKVCSLFTVVSGDDYEYQLIEDLLRGYDLRIRPSINSSEALNVTFGLALSQIIDVVSINITLCFILNILSFCISPNEVVRIWRWKVKVWIQKYENNFKVTGQGQIS